LNINNKYHGVIIFQQAVGQLPCGSIVRENRTTEFCDFPTTSQESLYGIGLQGK
jgi:hypothetical protein